jgi:hypothetical protein
MPNRTFAALMLAATIMALAGGLAQAAPTHWRTSEKDEAFSQEFSEKSIDAMRESLKPSKTLQQILSKEELQEHSEKTQHTIEAMNLIRLLISNNSNAIYNEAASICDERAAGVTRTSLISKAVRVFQDERFNIHPLTARYAGNQFVNVSIRSYCKLLMSE